MIVRFIATLCFLLMSLAAAHAVDIKKVQGKSGIEAWLVEDHTNPIITLSLAFRGGTALDPKGKEGLANFAAGLLDEGAGEFDSQAFRGRMADLSVSLSFSAGLETFRGSLTTLSENRDAAFELMRLALTKPRFDGEALARIRAQILTNLKRASQDPSSIATDKFYRAIFPGHPYARPTEGTEETVAGLSKADLMGFVKSRLAKNNLMIGVVGNITPEALSALIDKTFADLPDQATPWVLPEVIVSKLSEPILVDLPVPQSVIQFGQMGVKRKAKDFYPAYILNYILGGGSFSSRLYAEIREKRGLAYSPYTYLHPMNHSALLGGRAGTANARVGETLEVLKNEWRRMAEKGVTQQELDDAKTYLTGSFPLRFDSSASIANMLVSMQISDLGTAFLVERNKLVEAVTLEQVNRVAKNLLDPSGLAIVIVGQPEGLPSKK